MITAYPKAKRWFEVEWIAEQGGTDGEWDPDKDKWMSERFDDQDEAWEFAQNKAESSVTESARFSEHEMVKMEGTALHEDQEVNMDWVYACGEDDV